MNGPEHYRRAEELLAETDEIIRLRLQPEQPGPPDLRGLDREAALRAVAKAMEGPWELSGDPNFPERNIAEAQVHATLALAAATAAGTGGADRKAWADAGAIVPSDTPATGPAQGPKTIDDLVRDLAQEPPPPDRPGKRPPLRPPAQPSRD